MSIVMKGQRGLIVCEGVEWSDIGLRERGKDEKVHLRTEEGATREDICDVCGLTGGAWTDLRSMYEVHVARCTV